MVDATGNPERDRAGEDAAEGVVESAKGRAKEAIGTATGRDDLVREGNAQQTRANRAPEAAQNKAEAERDHADAIREAQRTPTDQPANDSQ